MRQMLTEIVAAKLFKKVLGRFDLLSLYIALIFGAYGSAQLSVDGWVGIPIILIASITFLIPLSFASFELGTLFPGEGGIYLWVQKTMGPLHGFISSWLSWVPIFLLIPLGASTVISHIQRLFENEFTNFEIVFAQLIYTLIITGISCLSLSISKRYINAMFFVSLSAVLLVFLCGVYFSGFKLHLGPISTVTLFQHGPLYSAAVLWLLGVEVPFNMGSEIKNTRSNAAFMLTWGSILLTVFYVLGIFGILQILKPGNINPITGLSDAVSIVSPSLGIVSLILVCFAVSSQDVAYMNSYSRLLVVSGIERKLPKALRYINKNGVPVVALLVQAVISVAVILTFVIQESLAAAFQLYLASLVNVWVLSLFYIYIALPIARYKFAEIYKEAGKVGKIPGGIFGLSITIIIGCLANIVAIFYVFASPWTPLIATENWRIWVGAITVFQIFIGLVVYVLNYIFSKKKLIQVWKIS